MISFKKFEEANDSAADPAEFVPLDAYSSSKLSAVLPVGRKMRPKLEHVTSAIQNGMVLKIFYKGIKDKTDGHNRFVYPMVLGKSSKGKLLVRGWHLKGFSVSAGGWLEREWRLFRLDRTKLLSFTGLFFRLAPNGYKTEDPVMRGGTIAYADLPRILENQERMIKAGQIESGLSARPATDKPLELKSLGSKKIDDVYSLPFFKGKDTNLVRVSILEDRSIKDRKVLVLDMLAKSGQYYRARLNGSYANFVVKDSFFASDLSKKSVRDAFGEGDVEVFQLQHQLDKWW